MKINFNLQISKVSAETKESKALYREDGKYTYPYGSAEWVYFNCLIGEVEGVSDKELIQLSGVHEWNIARQYMGEDRYKAAGGK